MSDYHLHLIIGVKEADIISFDAIRELLYLAHCKLGWTACDRDINLRSLPGSSRCSFIRVSNEELNNKVGKWLEVEFSESRFDETAAISVDDKHVIHFYFLFYS